MTGQELIDTIKNLGAEDAEIRLVIRLEGKPDSVMLFGGQLQIEVSNDLPKVRDKNPA